MMKSLRWGTRLMSVLLVFAGGCASYEAAYLSPEAPEVVAAPEFKAVVRDATTTSESVSEGEAVAETGNLEQTCQAPARLMTYDVSMNLVVQNIATTLESLKAITANLKGYMQGMTEKIITVRIPAARLNEALEQVGKLGEVTAQTIKGTDVTEEMMDLDIRVKTGEETRNRLAELLKKSDKVEDLLKVEKEMQRVVEELERIKGRIKYLSHAVAYSTLTVVLNSPVAQTEQRETVPFAWVRSLATEVVTTANASYTPFSQWGSWLKMEVPETFVKLSESDGRTRALSGSGVALLIRRHDNFEGGTPLFWKQIVRRWLVANKVIALGDVKDVELSSGAKGTSYVGTKTLGRKEYQYVLITVVNKKQIYTVECWGLSDEVAKEKEALEHAVKNLKVKP